jgi:hypothetical protein
MGKPLPNRWSSGTSCGNSFQTKHRSRNYTVCRTNTAQHSSRLVYSASKQQLLGVSLLNIFDVVNYALVGIMFLGLYVTLKQTNRDFMALAATLGLVGTAVYLASNTAFSMLSLSNQYATAATETEKTTFLAAGQTLLAMGQSTGVYTSLLLVAVAGFITSVVMLKSKVFGKVTAYVGILAGALDLIYCVTTFAFMPELDALFLASAGLCLMIWHILAGRKLYQLGQINQNRRCNS